MGQTMADRIESARRRRFVGRTAELSRLEGMLRSPEPGVVFVSGPSGVGKSTLLRRFAERAAASGAAVTLLDARDIPPTADAMAFRLSRATAATTAGRPVVIVDTYELLTEVDAAFRDEIAPTLPADTLLVIGGQYPPGAGWRTDPGWSDLLVSLRLPNLGDADSSAYLSARGIPVDAHAAAIEFTHGHPLALALVGEVLQEHGSFVAGRSADVIEVLLGSLIQHTPTVAHRRALEASAQVRFVTEPLLAALIEVPDAADHFGWLRSRPFVESGLSGLYLHDLARTVLSTDLRWRHPELYVQMHARAREFYLSRLDSPDPVVQAGLLLDLMYLHTDLRRSCSHRISRPVCAWIGRPRTTEAPWSSWCAGTRGRCRPRSPRAGGTTRPRPGRSSGTAVATWSARSASSGSRVPAPIRRRVRRRTGFPRIPRWMPLGCNCGRCRPSGRGSGSPWSGSGSPATTINPSRRVRR